MSNHHSFASITHVDPLPDDLVYPALPHAERPDEVVVFTSTDRPIDDELRELGYEVSWSPHAPTMEAPFVSKFVARKFQFPRRPARVFVGRLPYGNAECPDTTDWLLSLIPELQDDKRVADFRFGRIDDTPTSMCRNALASAALQWGADVLVMVDSDMKPDYLQGRDRAAQPFWQAAFDLWWHHPGPCLVGAPYCSGGDREEPLVFKWTGQRSPATESDLALAKFSRDEVATRHGYERVAALPTGLLLVDTQVFSLLSEPWFYYEYTSTHCAEKASTEDVTFTRDLGLLGVPLYVSWDSWAGHWKRKLVGKPEALDPARVPHRFRQAAQRPLLPHNSPGVTSAV